MDFDAFFFNGGLVGVGWDFLKDEIEHRWVSDRILSHGCGIGASRVDGCLKEFGTLCFCGIIV